MKQRKKQVWVTEEAYRAAKVASAAEGLKLTAYLDKKLCNDSKELIEGSVKKKEGYYGFLK